MRETTDDIRAEYSASLLQFSTGHKATVGTPLAFGEGDIKSRIKNVMYYKKPRLRQTVFALTIISVVTISLATNPIMKGLTVMSTIFENYKQLSLNCGLICLEPGEITVPYFCYPVNAEPVGFEEAILYCFIPEYGEMVFASNPESCADINVYPVANNFSDFIRLVLACGSANPIEQCIWMNKEQFDQLIQEQRGNQTAQQKEVLALLSREFNLDPMENPFEYIKAVQANFDDSKIKYSDEYYDTLGLIRPDGTKEENTVELEPVTFSFQKGRKDD